MNKKGQWAHAMARERRSQEREMRRVYARALTLLGFHINELVNFLGVSSNTVKTYLKEMEGAGYSDLFEFSLKPEIFKLFTSPEQVFLNFMNSSIKESKILSKESLRTSRISQGKGFEGWLHKNLLKDCDKFKEKNEFIGKRIKELAKETEEAIKDLKNPKKYPHLSKAKIKIEVKIQKNKE